ncbi:MAG: hypothetical protein WA949_12910 [Phormidesmis sp.]
MLKPPPPPKSDDKTNDDYNPRPLSAFIDDAAAYFRYYEYDFIYYAPMPDNKGLPVGKNRLKSIRRHVARWERREIGEQDAIRLFGQPLIAFHGVLPLHTRL